MCVYYIQSKIDGELRRAATAHTRPPGDPPDTWRPGGEPETRRRVGFDLQGGVASQSRDARLHIARERLKCPMHVIRIDAR